MWVGFLLAFHWTLFTITPQTIMSFLSTTFRLFAGLSFFIVFKHLILQYVIWGLFSLHMMFWKTLYYLSIMKKNYKFLSTFKFLIPACFVIFCIFVLLIWYRKGQGNADGGSFDRISGGKSSLFAKLRTANPAEMCSLLQPGFCMFNSICLAPKGRTLEL